MDNNAFNTVCLVLLVVVLLAVVALLVLIRNDFKNLLNSLSKGTKKYDFENDTKYAFFLIDYNCNNVRDKQLIPFQKSNDKMNLINDELFEKTFTSTATDILQMLSPDYRQVLLKYTNNVQDFITVFTYNKLLDTVTELNAQTIKSLSKGHTRERSITNANKYPLSET